jgi:ATP-dependent DNA helicase RecQ
VTSTVRDAIDEVARDRLGLERLRSGQRRAIAAAVGGCDVLAVMPTGYGKSAVYQVAGALIDGPAVVVSPLLALQRDQVESLGGLDVGEGAVLNSQLSAADRTEVLDRFARRELAFLFLAPEQLSAEDTSEALRAAAPGLFVVDEAHCITSWGHDFRPDYLTLGPVIDGLGHPRVIALTATATPPVQQEIVDRLGLDDAQIIVTGFDRPNLHVAVELFADGHQKDDGVVSRVEELGAGGAAGIVYAATRRRAEELAGRLTEAGLRAAPYHAGLPASAREETQAAFMDGGVDVVVATTAFGMGIDKPDVRFVVHADVADSVDSYYQEIGRAGRDGEPAEVVLFYRAADLGIRRYFSASGGVGEEQLQEVIDALDDADGELTREELAERVSLSGRRLTLAVDELESAKAVRAEADGTVQVLDGVDGVDLSAAAEAVAELAEDRKRWNASRVDMVRDYAETRTCRRRFLLTYFGESCPDTCGHCDNCETGRADDMAGGDGEVQPFPEGHRVRHPEWDEGTVIRAERDTITVLFDGVGYKTLSIALVTEGDLLEVVEG